MKMTRATAWSSQLLLGSLTVLAVACAAGGARPRVTSIFGDRPLHHLIREPRQEARATGREAALNDRPCDQNSDEVCNLPGLNSFPHVRMRSGYITVSEVSDRRLWYLVADKEETDDNVTAGRQGQEAAEDQRQQGGEDGAGQQHQEATPVVLWLSGGPGCSSLDAFIYEHGPFTFNYAAERSAQQQEEEEEGAGAAFAGMREATATGVKGGANGPHEVQLDANPYSWTKLATVIYVDSPAGTGFSFSGRPDVDYHTNDEYTIRDLVAFLEGLTARYPELATSPFFITGESYGGVFVPLLARELVRVNKERGQAGRAPLVDLQGYAIGNPVTDDVIDGNAQMRFAADMGYVDPPQWRKIRQACGDMFWNATFESDCWEAQATVKDQLWDLNWYDVLDACVKRQDPPANLQDDLQQRSPADLARRFFWPFTPRMHAAGAPEALRQQLSGPAAADDAAVEAGRRGGRRLWGPWLRHVVPCMDRRIALDWLNREEVRAALHAAPRSVSGEWQPCSDVLYYRLDTMDLVPVHEQLVREGLRVLVYSGDHDMVVPHTGTRTWVYDVADLGGAEAPLRPWNMDGQVAGFTSRFKAGSGLRYATVKGAGHMVPQSKPAAGLRLLESLLYNEEL